MTRKDVTCYTYELNAPRRPRVAQDAFPSSALRAPRSISRCSELLTLRSNALKRRNARN